MFYHDKLTPEEFATLKEAKGCTWYDGWQPYCMMCNTMTRMVPDEKGFQCVECKNLIGWNLQRRPESPLNRNQNQETPTSHVHLGRP